MSSWSNVVAPLRVLVCVSALLAAPAQAKEVDHVLRAGETLESVARHYYGASWKAVYLQSRNQLVNKRPAVGAKIAIPSIWTYTVRRGDTLGKLAKKYLGDLDRHRGLAEMNKLREGQDLQVGQELLMPFHLRYTLQDGESLSHAASRFYRNGKRADLLKAYNGGREPGRGATITVPIFDRAALDPSRRGPPPPPGASPPSADEPAAEGFDAKAVTDAVAAYHAGEFDRAQQVLQEQLEAGPPAASLPLMLQYLAFCAAAHDQPGDAEEYFRRWLELQPKATLDPVRTSPKLLDLFARAQQGKTSLLSPSDASAAPPP